MLPSECEFIVQKTLLFYDNNYEESNRNLVVCSNKSKNIISNQVERNDVFTIIFKLS